jgi:hypothetical protein
MSSASQRHADAHVDLNSIQASAYAQSLLDGVGVNPARFRDASICSAYIVKQLLMNVQALQRCQLALDEKTEEVQALRAELATVKANLMSNTNQAAKSGRRRV